MKKVKQKFIEQREKLVNKLSQSLTVDEILNLLAEIICQSYFKKHPHELQKIIGNGSDFF